MKKFKIMAVLAALVLALSCFVSCTNNSVSGNVGGGSGNTNSSGSASGDYEENVGSGSGNTNSAGSTSGDYSKETYYAITNADDLIGTWKGSFKYDDEWREKMNTLMSNNDSDFRAVSSSGGGTIIYKIEKKNELYYESVGMTVDGVVTYNQDVSSVIKSNEMMTVNGKTVTLKGTFTDGDEKGNTADGVLKTFNEIEAKLNAAKNVLTMGLKDPSGISEDIVLVYLVKQ